MESAQLKEGGATAVLNLKNLSKGLVLALVVGNFAGKPAQACPPGCADYNEYLVVLKSGFGQEDVTTFGKEISQKLGHRFSSENPNDDQTCSEDPEKCLVLISSKDEYIGKRSFTPEEAARGEMDKVTYAVAYVFSSYDTSKNLRKAKSLLRKVKPRVSDAYLKSIPLCACE